MRVEPIPREVLRGGRGALPNVYCPCPYALSVCESSLDGTPATSPTPARFEEVLTGKPELPAPSLRTLYDPCLDIPLLAAPLTGICV